MSPEEEKQLVSLLEKLEPGFYPEPVFQMFSRLTVSPIVELVPFRETAGGPEILLIQRPTDDPVWPGELHTPGTGVRPTDVSVEDCLKRISADELNGVQFDVEKTYDLIHHSGRGMEVAQIFYAVLTEDPGVGKFYPIEQLPENIIESQMDFIPIATKNFLADKSL